MGNTKKPVYHENEKARAVALYQRLKSFKAASELTGIARSTLRRWVQEDGSYEQWQGPTTASKRKALLADRQAERERTGGSGVWENEPDGRAIHTDDWKTDLNEGLKRYARGLQSVHVTAGCRRPPDMAQADGQYQQGREGAGDFWERAVPEERGMDAGMARHRALVSAAKASDADNPDQEMDEAELLLSVRRSMLQLLWRQVQSAIHCQDAFDRLLEAVKNDGDTVQKERTETAKALVKMARPEMKELLAAILTLYDKAETSGRGGGHAPDLSGLSTEDIRILLKGYGGKRMFL